MKIKFLLTLLLIPVLIIPVFALPAGTSFDEFCEKKTSNKKTTAADFICELDIYQMKDDIESNTDTIISLNNTVNQLTVRINELTALHYPDDEDVLVPPIPEIVPLPKQPVPGENPDLAPDTPQDLQVRPSDESIRLQWRGTDVSELPRGVDPPTYNIQYSDDGVNWISINSTSNGYLNIRELNPYTEYLVKLRAVNEFGLSPFTVINSGITASEGNDETGYIENIKNHKEGQNVKFQWHAASWLFGYELTGSVLEKSVNYGNFTHLIDLGVMDEDNYIDIDVEEGNVYSYRIQTTTTNEVHTRSGFTSILYTLD